MKDLGEASFILGMKINRDRSKSLLRLSQSMYIDIVLKRFSMKNFKKSYLPIGHEISLSKSDYPITPQEREHMSRISYASTVDSIIYVMTCVGHKISSAEVLGRVDPHESLPTFNNCW